MRAEKCEIFLSMTSNMISSGLREIVAQLVKEKTVKAIITTTGAIEEDVMKSMKPFRLGSFHVDDSELKANGMNRIGNILVTDDQYCELEDWHNRFMEEIVKKKRIIAPSEYIREMGLRLNDENSYLYWAAKNDIPVICPGFVDGALGDHLFFFNKKRKDDERLVIDVARDLDNLWGVLMPPAKVGGIILGGGIAKHHLIGAAILRDGLDYAVYISTGTEYDGSLSGAKPREAVSWNKLKSEENSVCIEADATLVFPLIAFGLLEK